MRILVAAILGVVFSGFSATAAPLEAYGRLPAIDMPALSPDGTMLAYASTLDGVPVAVVRDMPNHKTLLAMQITGQKLRYLSWAGNKFLLTTASQTANARYVLASHGEYAMVNSVNIATGQQKLLLDHVPDSMNVAEGLPMPRSVDGQEVVYLQGVYFPAQQGISALFAVNLGAGGTTLVEKNSPNALRWWVDESGRVYAEEDYDERSRHWRLRLKIDGNWKEVLGTDAAIDTPNVEGLSAEGDALIVSGVQNDGAGMQAVSLADGSLRAIPGNNYYLTDYLKDPKTLRIIGGDIVQERRSYRFFDPTEQVRWDGIMRAFPGAEIEVVSLSENRNKAILQVTSPTDGYFYAIADLEHMSVGSLGAIYANIGPADVSPVRPISYKASDGRQINAYLTLPKGVPEKNLPLVVFPHGGPAARDFPGFDWWAQAMASAGYAVLQPQFRGSDGFGADLLAAGYGEWGRKMQTDLSDGVRDLASRGVIDPKRVCIVGASYGGYAALAGAAIDTGVYRCAVSVAGLSDLRAFLRWNQKRAHRSDTSTVRFWSRFMGAKDDDDPVLDTISPAKQVEHVEIPVMLIHGRDDTVVPFDQSETMRDALKRAGKPVEFVALSGEDHWLSRSETRLAMLKATVEFLAKNNPAH